MTKPVDMKCTQHPEAASPAKAQGAESAEHKPTIPDFIMGSTIKSEGRCGKESAGGATYSVGIEQVCADCRDRVMRERLGSHWLFFYTVD